MGQTTDVRNHLHDYSHDIGDVISSLQDVADPPEPVVAAIASLQTVASQLESLVDEVPGLADNGSWVP